MKTVLRFLAVVLFPLALHAAAERPLWLACGPADLLKSLEPLAKLREAEGLETLMLPLQPDEALAKAPRRPSFMVIVGDDERDSDASPPWLARTKQMPFHAWQEKQRQNYPSDLAWAGLDR